MKSFRKLSLGAVLLLVMNIAHAYAQERETLQEESIPVVKSKTYEQVLDLLFPRDKLEEAKIRYAFVLRYEPSFDAESQIMIIYRADNVEAIEYKSADGNINTKLNEIFRRTGTENAVEMAKQIRITKRVININSAAIRRLRDSFFKRLCQSLEGEIKFFDRTRDVINITADGTKYRLWYMGLGTIFYEFFGTGADRPTSTDESPLMEWMKDVRRKITKLPSK